MEFLSRSWSASAFEISKALSPQPPHIPAKNGGAAGATDTIHEDAAAELEEAASAATVSGNPFSFASSETSQLIMERIMSQSVSKNRSFFFYFVCVCDNEYSVLIW